MKLYYKNNTIPTSIKKLISSDPTIKITKQEQGIIFSIDPYAQVLQNNVTLWVSNDGEDSNEGTEDNPFKTIQHAINILPKNLGNHRAIINVKPGIYDGFYLTGFYNGTNRGLTIQGTNYSQETMIKTQCYCYDVSAAFMLENLFYKLSDTQIQDYVLTIKYCKCVNLSRQSCDGNSQKQGFVRAQQSIVYGYGNVANNCMVGFWIDGSNAQLVETHGTMNNVCYNVGGSTTGQTGVLVLGGDQITGANKFLNYNFPLVLLNGNLQ